MKARRRRLLGLVALFLAIVMIVPGVSYVQALTAPGSATFTMRTVDWIRGHGGNPVINAIENWYYTRKKPAAGPPDSATLPTAAAPSRNAVKDTQGPAALPLLPGVTRLPGESTWHAGRLARNGKPLIYTGYLRPDAAHQSVVAGVAWMRAGSSVAHLVAGTTQPGGTWPGSSSVPFSELPNLVATFNSGFKMADISGGFYLDGNYARPLMDGQASIVIDKQGGITVGSWGRDVKMTANVAAVRQNLALIVENGQPVNGLSVNALGRWGSPRNQLQYTWRSGLGVDAHGNLIYVAGNHMNLTALATAMADAGVVRGMQLDIHTGMASFSSWKPVGGTSTPTKLLPEMTRAADRYLVPDQRDFLYLTAAGAAS
ncbi:phosphodiester glycosidase family protein [Actinoplanes bogorensis]|uniref:Phosphodiester glycosidase family protein n=1 Tax=Paractinoplanes bogorensis TaxID=1610840 RepID=A0ABS5YY49_9ACTN|nr:phosphodiester glycosidase family protein [Actinoplanes bogorensis]MBU2668001.1 phosphodiester glycosidase family protein [Actinoplanes bogorensis]